MCLLFLHIRKREDLELNIKEKILMIVFAPFMQMIFLARFFYYCSRGERAKRWKKEYKKVEIISLRLGSSIFCGSS